MLLFSKCSVTKVKNVLKFVFVSCKSIHYGSLVSRRIILISVYSLHCLPVGDHRIMLTLHMPLHINQLYLSLKMEKYQCSNTCTTLSSRSFLFASRIERSLSAIFGANTNQIRLRSRNEIIRSVRATSQPPIKNTPIHSGKKFGLRPRLFISEISFNPSHWGRERPTFSGHLNLPRKCSALFFQAEVRSTG